MDNNEVICISSDDEGPTPKHNVNRKETSKSVQADKNVSQLPEKKDIAVNETQQADVTKRKAMEIGADNNCDIPEKKQKLSQSTKGTNSLTCNETIRDPLDAESGSGIDVKPCLKPNLIVKEKRSVSPVDQHPFPMFLGLCLQRDRSSDMQDVVNKLKRRYEKLEPAYIKSKRFIDFLNEKRSALMEDKVRTYYYIREVMREMKNSLKGLSHLWPCPGDTDNSNTNDVDSVKLKKLKKIDKAMEQCQRCIKKLEEAEINFNEEENSSFLKLERYKARMVELYYTRCQILGERMDAGRAYLRPKRLKPTGIAVVDEAITTFINSKISKRSKLKRYGSIMDAVIFPDFHDILQCIQLCNDSHQLGLSSKKQRQIAKDAFKTLGEYLQKARHSDYWDTFSLYLEDEEDPAALDPDLALKLSLNRKEGEKRLSNVFEEYVKKQEALRDEDLADEGGTEQEEEDKNLEKEEDDSPEGDDSVPESDLSIKDLSSINTKVDGTLQNGRPSTKSLCDVQKSHRMNDNQANKNRAKLVTIVEGSRMPASKEKKSLSENNEEARSEARCSSMDMDQSKLTTDAIAAEGMHTEQPEAEEEELSKSETSSSSRALPSTVIPATADKSEEGNLPETETEKSVNTMENKEEVQEADRIQDRIEESEVNGDKENDEVEVAQENVENDQEIEDGQGGALLDEVSLGEEKPLLRLRSFAKPPTTWKDGEQKKEGSTVISRKGSNANEPEIVDLTESPTLKELQPKAMLRNTKSITVSNSLGNIINVGGVKLVKLVKVPKESVIGRKLQIVGRKIGG